MTLVSDRDPAINLARPIRRRSTKAEVERRRARLLEIVEAMKPMTVRQVFITIHHKKRPAGLRPAAGLKKDFATMAAY